MTETPDQPDSDVDEVQDPDADPENLNPRDLRDAGEYEGDPDADPPARPAST
ncbi:MAG TPA: hypothetical protein VFX33_06910 [Actinomycetales bacterium]|nr:hypothetical protein [Actinomycetales bacterium]